MTHREGVVASVRTAVASAVLTLALVLIASLIISIVPHGAQHLVGIAFTLLIAGSGFMAIAALLILISALLGRRDDVQLARSRARRNAAPTLHPSTTTPFSTTLQPTIEDATADLLHDAIARREEALREADRIAHILNVLHREISE